MAYPTRVHPDPDIDLKHPAFSEEFGIGQTAGKIWCSLDLGYTPTARIVKNLGGEFETTTRALYALLDLGLAARAVKGNDKGWARIGDPVSLDEVAEYLEESG